MTFMNLYCIQLRLYIHRIQLVHYHINCLEVRLKGPDIWTVVFTIDLIGIKLWWKFWHDSLYTSMKHSLRGPNG